MNDILILLLAVLSAIYHSELFWFAVAGIFISYWIRWIVKDAVKSAIREINLDGRVRDAVTTAIGQIDLDERVGDAVRGR